LLLVAPRSAHAQDKPALLSLSVERVAGVSYTSIRPSSASASYGITTFGIAGPAVSPVALPRIGADVLLPMGLTLGGGLGYGNVSLSYSPDNGPSSSESANAWLFSPRVGYLVHLGPLFDLWPRAGLTFAGAGIQAGDSQACTVTFVNGQQQQSCTTYPGPSDSIFLVAASVDLAAAWRVTRSFNLLGGLSYDHVVSASASETTHQSSGSSQSNNVDVGGKYFGPQLWLGLGGYLL
jgi:hypothetical protein